MSVRHSNKKRKNVAKSRVSRLLQTVSRYISRDKYRDTSMHRWIVTTLLDTYKHLLVSVPFPPVSWQNDPCCLCLYPFPPWQYHDRMVHAASTMTVSWQNDPCYLCVCAPLSTMAVPWQNDPCYLCVCTLFHHGWQCHWQNDPCYLCVCVCTPFHHGSAMTEWSMLLVCGHPFPPWQGHDRMIHATCVCVCTLFHHGSAITEWSMLRVCVRTLFHHGWQCHDRMIHATCVCVCAPISTMAVPWQNDPCYLCVHPFPPWMTVPWQNDPCYLCYRSLAGILTALTDLLGLQLATMSIEDGYNSPYSMRYSHNNSNNILYWNGQLVWTPALGLYLWGRMSVRLSASRRTSSYVITSDCYWTSSYVIT